jgi:ankyrin repeat protein
VNAIDEIGQIALHTACENGNIDIVNILLKYNSSVNLCDTDATSIQNHVNVFYTHFNNVYIISMSGYMNSRIKNAFVNVTIIVNQNMYNICMTIYTSNNCDVIDNNGFSPALYYACIGGSVDVVDLLLRNKCNINQCQPRKYKSLLIVACTRNKEAVVKLFLSYDGCDVNIIMSTMSL